jgi:hypothetical protein
MEDLSTRIEAAYQRRTGAQEVRGARAWFAREARITPRHLSKLLKGEHPMEGPMLAVLELLEKAPKKRPRA